MEVSFLNAAQKAMNGDVVPMLDFMREYGSCVTLTWDEGVSYWECSWISGGDRFVGLGISQDDACTIAIDKCVRAVRARNSKGE